MRSRDVQTGQISLSRTRDGESTLPVGRHTETVKPLNELGELDVLVGVSWRFLRRSRTLWTLYERQNNVNHLIDRIQTGDAERMAAQLPNSSIDFIFTDPVYSEISQYRWLGETAARILKPDSACLVWCSQKRTAEVQEVMSRYLDYVYTLTYVVPAKSYRLNQYHLFCWSTPCLWFSKGKTAPSPWIPDTIISHNQTSNGFKWQKNPEAISKWLVGFTRLGDLVADFYTGTVPVPAVCKMTGRHFVACEIDPERAEQARTRLDHTPVPMILPEMTQLQLELEG